MRTGHMGGLAVDAGASGRGIAASRKRTLPWPPTSLRSTCKFLLYNRLADRIRLASALRIRLMIAIQIFTV